MESKTKPSGLLLAVKTSIVSFMTFLSRILGLVRDIVFAQVFGAGLLMDAFLVAQRIPNMLRRFFAEGAFSAGFIPVMARYKEGHTEAEAQEYVGSMAGTFAVVLFVVTLLGVVGSALLVVVVAPGFIGEGGDFDLASLMLKFTFPYLLFISLTAFAGGVLNTYGNFAIPAFTPVILNVILITAAVWVAPHLEEPVMALAYGVLAAGVLQLLFQLPFLAKVKMLVRPRWAPTHEGVRRAFKLMVPAIFGSSVAQINVLLSGIIASLLPIGSISYLYYSDRLMEFPLGLFGIALATVTLPYLSRLWASDDRQNFTATLDWSMRIATLIAVPSALGLFLLAGPLVATLFYGGEFDVQSVQMTTLALQAYAAGLVGFSFVKVLAPAFFAREDTKTPVRIGIIALCVNLALGVSIAWYLMSVGFAGPHVALAGATSVAAVLNALLLWRGLRRDGILDGTPEWGAFLLRVAVGNAAMWGVLSALARAPEWWLSSSVGGRVAWLAVTVIAGATTYFLVLLLLGLRPSQFQLRSS